MGINEAAGYLAVSLTALATGFIAAQYGLRPEPFYLGLAYAALGLRLSAAVVRETTPFARLEAAHHPLDISTAGLTKTKVFVGRAGVGQLFTGAWSDRIGRKPLIVAGMWLQAAAIAAIPLVGGVVGWAAAMVLLGAGTALVYLTLLAAIGDIAHPSWRASAVGVYRLWRDLGFAVGALLTGHRRPSQSQGGDLDGGCDHCSFGHRCAGADEGDTPDLAVIRLSRRAGR